MNLSILNTASQAFINDNLYVDCATLLLKGTSVEGVETKELVAQIEAKKRLEKKLPTWFKQDNIYYPNKINIEQTSSEITADYKASLLDGKTLIDLTGGFGVDAYYFAKRMKSVIHCEVDKDLSEIMKHNFDQLSVRNVEIIPTDGLAYLKHSDIYYDWIYVDPSRRHDSKGKVFMLKDCLPDITTDIDAIFKLTDAMMVKTSPLLDISLGLSELKYVTAIHVIAVNNEVKELLWILKKDADSDLWIKTVNLKSLKKEVFNFRMIDEANTEPDLGLPGEYLYEPNAAIMKSGGFNEIAKQLAVCKLHKHSHLYTSDELIDFPGRRFKILQVIPYNKKSLKNLSLDKANITTRNFPDTVAKLRAKFGIKDGGSSYLFFTTDMNNEKKVLLCSKIG